MERYANKVVEELLNFTIKREEPFTEEQHKEVERRYKKLGCTVESFYDDKAGKNTVRFQD